MPSLLLFGNFDDLLRRQNALQPRKKVGDALEKSTDAADPSKQFYEPIHYYLLLVECPPTLADG